MYTAIAPDSVSYSAQSTQCTDQIASYTLAQPPPPQLTVQMTILSLVLLFGHVNADSATTPAPSPPMYATTGTQATTSTMRRMQSGVPVFTSKLTEGCSIDECCATTISGMCNGNTALSDGTPAQPDVDCNKYVYIKHLIPAKRGRTLKQCCQGTCGHWRCHPPNFKPPFVTCWI